MTGRKIHNGKNDPARKKQHPGTRPAAKTNNLKNVT